MRLDASLKRVYWLKRIGMHLSKRVYYLRPPSPSEKINFRQKNEN